MRTRSYRVIAVLVAAGCQAAPPSDPVRFASPSPSPSPSPSGAPFVVPSFQTPGSTPSAAPTPTATAPSASADDLPAVQGADPAPNVLAFYYPWYETGPNARHWHDNVPTGQISSDYWPVLGPYSSSDRNVVAQHMAWLRQAGIGVIATSWWGPGSFEDQRVRLVMEMANRYGIKVAFHIEPYGGRSAGGLVSDIQYIYDQYGSSPAFFRSTATSRYSPQPMGRGMFFVWEIDHQYGDGPVVAADYWRNAVNSAHALSTGALVIANTQDGKWVGGGHFDGLYNYASLNIDSTGFDWAHSMPPDSLFIPSVIPGFSGHRIGDTASDPRAGGSTYDTQWKTALGTGVAPAMMTITSFNEWHEGTQIEPAAASAPAGGGTYDSYSPLAPEAYLDDTLSWIGQFHFTTWPSSTAARINVETTSDWTNVSLSRDVLRSELIDSSPQATETDLDWTANKFVLTQPIDRANSGASVAMTFDVALADLTRQGRLQLTVTRGGLGTTTVTVFNLLDGNAHQVAQFNWGGTSDELNTKTFSLALSKFFAAQP